MVFNFSPEDSDINTTDQDGQENSLHKGLYHGNGIFGERAGKDIAMAIERTDGMGIEAMMRRCTTDTLDNLNDSGFGVKSAIVSRPEDPSNGT